MHFISIYRKRLFWYYYAVIFVLFCDFWCVVMISDVI